MKKPFWHKVGDEVINETITTGLSFLVIVFGFNYFNLKYAWIKLIESLGQNNLVGEGFIQEFNLIAGELARTFPFNYIIGDQSLIYGSIVGIILILLGIGLKLLTKTTKEEFVKDMGKNIYVPAIIGLLSMLIVQVTIMINSKIDLSNINMILYVWNNYGKLLILGFTTLLLGSVCKMIAIKQDSNKLKVLANTLLNGAYMSLGYYIILRIIVIADYNPFNMFIISGTISANIILFCIFMFTFGLELKNYGEILVLRRRQKFKVVPKPL
jgi:hypothetical protein